MAGPTTDGHSGDESAHRQGRRTDGKCLCAGGSQAEKHQVAGHRRDEDAAQAQDAHRVQQPGDHRKRQ